MEQAEIIRWEDPSPPQHTHFPVRSSRWEQVASELRDQPKRWAVVHVADSKRTGLASRIAKGRLDAFSPAGDFDATSRIVDGRAVTYARYVGDIAW